MLIDFILTRMGSIRVAYEYRKRPVGPIMSSIFFYRID